MPLFRWFRTSDGLEEVEDAFVAMLRDGRRVFDLAVRARVHGEDPAALSEELLLTEERTDEAERRIRRLVLVHASVHGATDISACLMYMSITKDAERIGDLSKNLWGIAQNAGAAPPGPLRDDFQQLVSEISPMIEEAAAIFGADDQQAAADFIERARALQQRCRERIDALLSEQSEVPQPAASALTYRHLARIVANLLNIVSAVVVPLDQLDYPAEDARDPR